MYKGKKTIQSSHRQYSCQALPETAVRQFRQVGGMCITVLGDPGYTVVAPARSMAAGGIVFFGALGISLAMLLPVSVFAQESVVAKTSGEIEAPRVSDPEAKAAPESSTEGAAASDAGPSDLTTIPSGTKDAELEVVAESGLTEDDEYADDEYEDEDEGLMSGMNMQFHLAGTWSAGFTNRNQRGDEANPRGRLENAFVALNTSANPVPQLTFNTQVMVLAVDVESTAILDFAFGEWRFNNNLSIRVGQLKLPIGLYTEIFDIAVQRPFLTLPVSIYGPAGIVSEFYRGAALTYSAYGEEWGIVSEIFAGGVEVADRGALHVLQRRADGSQGAAVANDEYRLVGTNLRVETPMEGLRLAAGGYYGVSLDGGTRAMAMGSIAYSTLLSDDVELALAGELARVQLGGAMEEFGNARQGFFLEGELTFYEAVALAAQYQVSHIGYPDGFTSPHGFSSRDFESLNMHREIAFGLSYKFSQNFILRTSYHYTMGNRFVTPVERNLNHDFIMAGNLQRNTSTLLFGVAFGY